MSIIKVKTGGITADAITSTEIADNAVVTAAINADAVTDAKIADDVIGTEHLTANEVDTTALGADAVTAAQIADDAISEEHLDVTAITGQTAETSIATDDLILLSDTSASGALKKMTRANFVSGIGGSNTPNFEARKTSGNQSISNTTWTKVNFESETFDSDNAFDLSNERFTVPSGEGGKYFLYACIQWNNDDRGIRQIAFYKNGSEQKVIFDQDGHDQGAQMASSGAILDLSASDYIEVYCYQSTGDHENVLANGEPTYFGGFKLI